MSQFLRPLNVFILSFFIVAAFVVFNLYKTNAASTPNLLTGYAWSSNIGWISLSCKNLNTCGASNYQVTIDPFNGRFAGYAWSSNIGWIRFDPPGPYPSAPNNFASVLTVQTPSGERNQVQGWIRSCSVFLNQSACSGALDPNNGGWDGWIKMSGSMTNCPSMTNPSVGPYETCIAINGRSLEGWAWGGDVLGWIQFDGQYNSISIPPGSVQIKEIRPQ